jgi:hypothetical protein
MNHDIDRTQVGYGQGAGQYAPASGGSLFNEDTHMNLAAELMDVNNEQELDNFLGDLISGAADAVGKFVSSPTGQALGSGLKSVAKQLLPVAGQALGGYVGGGAGSQVGGALGTAAAGLLDSEVEEQEWEAANTFVKLASEATKKAADMPPGADPHAVAEHAIIEAAKIHAPHLVASLTGEGHGAGCQCGCRRHHRHHHGEMRRHAGRWYRHGEKIVLVGV